MELHSKQNMPMTILAFAEQRNNSFKKSACEVVSTGRDMAKELGAELVAVAVGNGVESIAGSLSGYGAAKVVVVDHPRLASYSSTAYSKVIAEVAKRNNATIILLPSSSMGKDIAPRLAIRLAAGVAADCTALKVDGGDVIATRPVYAGKALLDIKLSSPVKIFTLRPNVFPVGASGAGNSAIEKATVELNEDDFSSVVANVTTSSGRPDVTEAEVIVSGGRGMKGPEHFHLIEELADTLNAAVGASRAAVDAGWRPHGEQVGQTGKVVSPTLYVACGISGAIQHLAGMSSSKYIVAINKDKDAPIFQIADYGIVGDVFEILPALAQELKKSMSN
jgi:electron transfer flavoprotein alpha subunit